MKKKSSNYRNDMRDASLELGQSPDDTLKQIGCFEIVQVVREFVPLVDDPIFGSTTYGAHLDNLLADAVRSGVEIQDVTLHIEKDTWQRFARGIRGEERN